MLYLRLFWDIFTFKSFKVAMYFFCSLTVILMMGLFSEIQNSWRSLFDQGLIQPHFFAIMDRPLSISQIQERILGIKTIDSVKSLSSQEAQRKIAKNLQSMGLDMPIDMLKENFGMYEIQFKVGSESSLQQESRNYFLNEFLTDGVMATEIQGNETIKNLGPLKTWLRDYFLLGVLVMLMILSMFSLWEFARESSYRANVIESFHRKKNVALKMFLFSWPPLALLVAIVPFTNTIVEATTIIFLLFWVLFNLSMTIMCQHAYYVKRSH